jgi:hypothetical protein
MNDTFDTEPIPTDDLRLLTDVGRALGSDPLPAGLIERAQALGELRDVDRDLADLLDDAASELTGTRGQLTAGSRLAFELADGSVSLELVARDGGLRGQLLCGNPAAVVLETTGRAELAAAVDDLGRFSFTAVPPGPARLRLRGAGTRPVTTDWFLL